MSGGHAGDGRDGRVAVAVAVGLSAAEGLAFLALGVSQLAAAGADVSGPAAASAAFFLVCSAGLAWCTRGLLRRQPWSRGPLVVSQLLLLAIAWSYHAPYPGWAGLLASTAAACLALLLAPSTTRALGQRTT